MGTGSTIFKFSVNSPGWSSRIFIATATSLPKPDSTSQKLYSRQSRKIKRFGAKKPGRYQLTGTFQRRRI